MEDYCTLEEAIRGAAVNYPKNGFVFQNQAGEEKSYSFAEIDSVTRLIAGGLQELQLRKGDHLGLIVTEPEHFVLSFLAAIRIGVVPVPVYPPLYLGSMDSYFRQTEAILRSSGASVLAVSRKLIDTLSGLVARVPGLKRLVAVEDLRLSSHKMREQRVSPNDIVFLQYTSGSTMEPRGVMVTHRSLISNIHCFMGEALHADPNKDKGVTWLPLYHDMGLVGFVLGPLYWGVSVVFIPTLRFVKNVGVWMETIHAHRGTITFAPNFAYALMLRRVRPADLQRWDLSSVKALGCGAEPIQPETIRKFLHVFGTHCGLSPHAFMPAYGLAESTLAVAIRRLSDGMRTETVNRVEFEATGHALAPTGGSEHLEHVSCGAPFENHQIQIRDSAGDHLPEGCQGEIWVKGPSVCAGYAGDPTGWSEVYRDGWLKTGDLGYLRHGSLFISGRSKDLIILNGRNLHPQVVEWVVNGVNGVRPDCVVAFSKPSGNGEELVIIAETKDRTNPSLINDIADTVQQAIHTKPVDIVCVLPGKLARTSSGKLRRQQVRCDYLSGHFRPNLAQKAESAAAS